MDQNEFLSHDEIFDKKFRSGSKRFSQPDMLKATTLIFSTCKIGSKI